MVTTPNLSLTEPNYNDPNWNVPLNSNFTILDNFAGGVTSISVSGSSPQTLSASQYQSMVLNFSGVLSTNFVYNFPIGVGGQWLVRNSCTGANTLSLGYNGNYIVIPVGSYLIVSIDTSNSPNIFFVSPSSLQSYAGNPNGFVAGNAAVAGVTPATLIWDTANNIAWVCTTSGYAATAVWSPISSTVQYSVTTGTPVLSANANNYAFTGSIVRLDASAAVSITGLAAGGSGRYAIFENISGTSFGGSTATGYNITFANQSASSSAANRFLIGFNYVLPPGQSVAFWYDATSTSWRLVGAPYSAPFTPPGLRLTLATGTPVMSANVTAATTVYYTPHINGYINLPNGSGSWYTAATGEISQALSDATKSPAAAAASSAYDVFVWNDAGTIRATRGPAWTSTTARSAGTALTRDAVAGVYVNSLAITNGPAAGMGVYVGSFCTNATTTVDWVPNPAAAAGGGNARSYLWNYYNRVPFSGMNAETTASWIPTAAWASFNNSVNNRFTLFCGLALDNINVTGKSEATTATGGFIYLGVGVDSTTVNSAFHAYLSLSAATGSTSTINLCATYTGLNGLGLHFYQLLQKGNTATNYVGAADLSGLNYSAFY